MPTVPDVSAMVRTYYNAPTLAACLESLTKHKEITDIAVTTNEPPDGPAHSLVPEMMKVYPQITFHHYPHNLTPFDAAKTIPLDDPTGWWNYANFAHRKCKNDQVLKVDGDQVLIFEGARKLFETSRTQEFLGLTCWELTSPKSRTKEFTGEEPRYWNKNLGVKFYRFPGQGFEYIWNPHWGTDKFTGWGPCIRRLGADIPVFLHYGWLTSTDPVRPARNLEQVPYTGTHSNLVDLEKAFEKCTPVREEPTVQAQPVTEERLAELVSILKEVMKQ